MIISGGSRALADLCVKSEKFAFLVPGWRIYYVNEHSRKYRPVCAGCLWCPSHRPGSSTGSMNNVELTFSYHFLFPPSFPFSPPPCAIVKIERQTCKLSLWCLHHHDPPHHSLFPDSRVITLIHLRLFSLSSTGAGEPKQEERLSGQTGSGEKVLR